MFGWTRKQWAIRFGIAAVTTMGLAEGLYFLGVYGGSSWLAFVVSAVIGWAGAEVWLLWFLHRDEKKRLADEQARWDEIQAVWRAHYHDM